jgi:uncharacterized protein YijF (DUF1287 family)
MSSRFLKAGKIAWGTFLLVAGIFALFVYRHYARIEFLGSRDAFTKQWLLQYTSAPATSLTAQDSFYNKLAEVAFEQTKEKVVYDPSYVRISYPNGDVPRNTGVCADVVIRAYRALDIDLQQLVHEDISKNFNLYPKIWKLSAPDSNIDHRRVPNLMVYFSRFGEKLTLSRNPVDYNAGDLVTWIVSGSLPHIGIVSDRRSADGTRLQIIHNIGAGPQLQDRLFEWPITGHFRFTMPTNEKKAE